MREYLIELKEVGEGFEVYINNGYLKTFSSLSSGESLVEIERRFSTFGKLMEINGKKPFAYFFKTEKDLEEINGLFKQ